MKLVSSDDSNIRASDEFYKLYKHSSPTKLKRMTDLDTEINNILSTPIEPEIKAKLYSQTLRKFLAYKKQHLEDTVYGGLDKTDSKQIKPISKKKSSTGKKKSKKTSGKILPPPRITPKKKKAKAKQPKAPKKGKTSKKELSSVQEIGDPQTSKPLPKKSKTSLAKKEKLPKREESSESSYDEKLEKYLSYIQDGSSWENY
jgi:hypothetical protein